jgi:hypothetical protein
LVIYLDPFKAMRMAKENVELGELYFRQAQKRYIKIEQEKAMINSQQNAEAQQASIQAKMQADSSIEQQRALTKEKEIILQGVFDLAKANIPVPAELQTLVASMLQNVIVPISVQNEQQQQALAQQQQAEMEQMQQQMQAMALDLKYGQSVTQIKEDGNTKRKLMDVTSRAHNTETIAEVKVNDQNTRSITSQNKTEIDALVKMLIARMSPDQLLAEIDRLNAEQQQYAMTAAMDIDLGQNPLMQQ